MMRPAPVPELEGADWPFFMPAEEKSYRVGAGMRRVQQFIVQDADGYLVRFSQHCSLT